MTSKPIPSSISIKAETVLINLSSGFHGNSLIKNTIRELEFKVDKRVSEEFVKEHFSIF